MNAGDAVGHGDHGTLVAHVGSDGEAFDTA